MKSSIISLGFSTVALVLSLFLFNFHNFDKNPLGLYIAYICVGIIAIAIGTVYAIRSLIKKEKEVYFLLGALSLIMILFASMLLFFMIIV